MKDENKEENKENAESDSDIISNAAIERFAGFILNDLADHWYFYAVIIIAVVIMLLMLHYHDIEIAACNSFYQERLNKTLINIF